MSSASMRSAQAQPQARGATSPLLRTTQETPTELWNDGCEPLGLERALARGATGATSNPVLVMSAIDADRARWDDIARAALRARPSADEEEIAWALVGRATQEGAAMLRPIFERTGGTRGRMSVQTSPRLYRDARRMVAQGTELAALAPNVAVKLPTTAAGLDAMEELTARGVVVNATVSFSVSHALLAAEAIERGLARLDRRVDRERMTPWVTIMAGRLDDHLRDVVAREHVDLDPETVRHASTAVVRRAYQLFRARGHRAKLLVAAMRSHHHWSEHIGGELVITIPPEWQDRFDASGVEVRSRIDDAVDPEIVGALSRALPDFVRAYEEGAMRPEELASYGASVATLRQFLGALDRLTQYVRDVMLPPPPEPR